MCLQSECGAALAAAAPAETPPLAGVTASPGVPAPAAEAAATSSAEPAEEPTEQPSLGPVGNPSAESRPGLAAEPAADLDGERAAAPSFELQARVISGFEVQRSRPSGDQTRPAEKDVGFQVRQARIELDAERKRFRLNLSLDLADALSSDISGGYDSPPFLRNATLEYRYSKALRLLVGRYKRPLSRIELTSAADLPVLRRGLLNGLVIKDNQWGDRAVGAMLSGRLEPAKLRWYVSLTNPDWSTSLQSQGVDVIARVQLTPIKALSLGLDGGYKYLRLGSQAEWTHDFAIGGDVGWKVAGVHLLLEGHFADLPFETGRPQAVGGLLLADYVFELSQHWSLQPTLFAELADANAKVSETESVRFAAGLNLLGSSGFRVLPQVALVRPLGHASQQNPWLDNETYSLVFSLAL